MSARIGSLFSGYGGLDMAVQSVVGGRVAWVSDIEPGPSRILATHHPDIPNLGDVTTIDWRTVEPVDVICGGSPCQDLSMAGRRAGMRPGTRSGLWESMLAAITTIRPRLVVWENVLGALSADAFTLCDLEPGSGHLGDRPARPSLRALGRVLGDLAAIGYDAGWCCLRASDIGAPHRRERVFVVAHPQGQPWGSGNRECGVTGDPDRAARVEWRQPAAGETQGGRARAGAGRSDRALTSHLLPTPIAGRPHASCPTGALIQTSANRFGPYAQAITMWETVLGRAAPDPTEVSSGSRRKCEVHGDSKEVRSGKVLHRVREANVSQTVREREIGRSRSFPAEEALFTGLCEYKRKSDREPVPPSCQGTSGNGLRDMWDSTGSTCTSCGPRSRKQQYVESENTMRELPSTTSLAGRSGQAPGGHSASKTCTCKRVLSTRFCEWMMGLPDGWVTDVDIPRTAQLRALGNGVVPQQAAAAIRAMLTNHQRSNVMNNLFRKRPVTIEARQLGGDMANDHDIYLWIESSTQGSFDPLSDEIPTSGVSIDPFDGSLMIATLEGVMRAHRGDWIIRGVAGEFYPCKDDIFRATYEPAGEAA